MRLPILAALLLASPFTACASSDRIARAWPGSYLVVLEKNAARAAVIEPNSGSVKDRYDVGVGPHEVAVSRNGEFAVVCDYGDGQTRGSTLTVIDLFRRVRETTIDLAPHERPHGIAFLDRRSTVLVTSETSSAVLEVSLRGREVERTFPTGAQGSHMLALSPDTRRAYTANIMSGTVSVLDLEQGTLVTQVQVGGQSEGIDVGPDGRIWVGVNDQARVAVIDPRSLEVVAEVGELPLPIRLKAAPDGKLVVVSCAASGEVALIDARSLQVVARLPLEKLDPVPPQAPPGFTPGTPVPVGIAIDPDSRLAFVTLQAAGRVAVVDLEEKRVRGYFEGLSAPDGIAFFLQRADPRGSLLDGGLR